VLIRDGRDGTFAWDLFAPALAQRLTTLAVDLRGHGRFGLECIRRYRTEYLASDVAQVIDQSEVGDLILLTRGGSHDSSVRSDAGRVDASALIAYAS
jgi:pimeloyl-ACP methyl ester carboxylesterase